MKRLSKLLSAFTLLVTAATPSFAVVTSTHLYDLGEFDSGAAAGNTASATTVDSIGGLDLARSGSPIYTSSTPAPGSTLATQFFGGADRFTGPVVSTAQNNFGIELWVTPDNSAPTSSIAYNGNSSNAGYGLYQFGGNYVGLFGGIAFVGSSPIVNGQATHLALVRDNGTTTLYVDGIAKGTSGATPNIPAGLMQIGGNANNATEGFSGVIDQVRTFEFTPGQFNKATDLGFAPKFTVLSHYRLGENDPGAASGNTGNSITIDDTGLRNLNRFGSPVYSSNTPGIVSSRSMSFDGTNGNNYSAGPVITTATDNFVLEAWVNAGSTTGVDIVAYNGNTSNAGFGLIRNGNEWQALYGGVAVLDFDAPVTLDEWTHLALVREGGLARLFVDGLQVGSAIAGGMNLPAGSFMIGGNPNNAGESFQGLIDEVRLSLLDGAFTTKMLLLNENVVVNVIPEPAALSLILLAGAALGGRRRRAA